MPVYRFWPLPDFCERVDLISMLLVGSDAIGLPWRQSKLRTKAMINGTVKFFNTTKGFGFISPEGGDKDAFVHISAVERSGLAGLYEGDKVTYELETGRDGKMSATNLTLL
jgi:CspA family cold shock protein